VVVNQIPQVRVKVEFGEGSLKGRQQSDGHTDSPGGLEDVDATADPGDGFGQVIGTPFDELRPVLLTDGLPGQGLKRKGWDGFARDLELASDAQGGGQTGFEVKVAGSRLIGDTDQGFQIHSRQAG